MGFGMDNNTRYQYERYVSVLDHNLVLSTTGGGPANETIPKDKNWAVLGVLPIVFFVAMGNILVILAVKMDYKLRSSTNYFLTSLAVADLLVAITVMPPSLAMIINGYNWPFPEGLCGIWIMLDVCFSTSSILHLCMISLDRYLALAKPFLNGGWLSKNSSSGAWSTDKRGNSKWRNGSGLGSGNRKITKRVAKRIVLVWATALGIAMPLPIMGYLDKSKIFNGDTCAINIPEYTIYGSLVAFFLPLVIMFITYSLTIRTLQKQSKCVKLAMGKDGSSHRGRPSMTPSVTSRYMQSRSSTGSTKTFMGKRVSSVTTDGSPLPDIFCAAETGRRMKKRRDGRNNSGSSGKSFKVSYKEKKIKICALLCCVCIRRSTESTNQEKDFESGMQSEYDEKTKNSGHKSESDTSETSSLNQPIVGRSPMLTRANMKLAKVVSKLPLNRVSAHRISVSQKSRAIATEQRASKVLGMIFTLFCLFWCPFFITNAFIGICNCYGIQCKTELMGNLMNWFVWIGYVSSGVNPCVYTLFSKQFRGTFRKLISCRCTEIDRSRGFHRSYVRDVGTVAGFSASSFQHSMELRDAYRRESFARSALVVRQTKDRPSLRTFGESIAVRQHRRTQVAQSMDTGGLLNNRNDKPSDTPQAPSADKLQWRSSDTPQSPSADKLQWRSSDTPQSPSVDKLQWRSSDKPQPPSANKLQWRSTWHSMLDAEDNASGKVPASEQASKPTDKRRNSGIKFKCGQWTDHHRRRILLDPDHKGRLPQQDSIPEDDVQPDSRATGNGHFFMVGQSSVPSKQHSAETDGRFHENRKAKFHCGSSDDEDNDNNNLSEVFNENVKEYSNFSDLTSTGDVGLETDTRVRFSPKIRCKACSAIYHVQKYTGNECAEQDESLHVFKPGVHGTLDQSSLTMMPWTQHNAAVQSNSRPHIRYQHSRIDSGVGESVRNSDSLQEA